MKIEITIERDGIEVTVIVEVADNYTMGSVRGAVIKGSNEEIDLTKVEQREAIERYFDKLNEDEITGEDEYFEDR